MNKEFLKDSSIPFSEKLKEIEKAKVTNFRELMTRPMQEIIEISNLISKVYDDVLAKVKEMDDELNTLNAAVTRDIDFTKDKDIVLAAMNERAQQRRRIAELEGEKSRIKLTTELRNETINLLEDKIIDKQRNSHHELSEEGKRKLTDLNKKRNERKDKYDKAIEEVEKYENKLKEMQEELNEASLDTEEDKEIFDQLYNKYNALADECAEKEREKAELYGSLLEAQNEISRTINEIEMQEKLQENLDEQYENKKAYMDRLEELAKQDRTYKIDVKIANELSNRLDDMEIVKSAERERIEHLCEEIKKKTKVEVEVKEPKVKPRKKEKIDKKKSTVAKGKVGIIKKLSKKIRDRKATKGKRKEYRALKRENAVEKILEKKASILDDLRDLKDSFIEGRDAYYEKLEQEEAEARSLK